MKKTADSVLLSVIMPTYNGKKFLKGVIDSVLSQIELDFRFYIVVDNSTDGSYEYIKASFHDKRIVLIRNDKNLGYTNCVILAYRSIKSKYVLLLNDDVTFDPNFFSKLVKSVETSDDVAGVIPMCYKDKHDIEKGNQIYYAEKKGFSISLVGNDITIPAEYHPRNKDMLRVFYSGIIILKTELVGKKLFDEDFFMYCEDMYICWRLNLQGYKVYFNPKITLWHYGGSSKEFNPEINVKASYHGTKNKVMNLLLFYNVFNIIRLMPLMFISEALYLFYEPKKLFLKLEAYAWLILHLPKIAKKRKFLKKYRKRSDNHIFLLMGYRIHEASRFSNPVVRFVVHCVNAFAFLYSKVVLIKTRDN